MDQLTNQQITWLVGGFLYVLICGGFGSYASTEKNREWYEGFLFGAVFGPFGVIAAACMPTRQAPVQLSFEERVAAERKMASSLRAPREQYEDEQAKKLFEKLGPKP